MHSFVTLLWLHYLPTCHPLARSSPSPTPSPWCDLLQDLCSFGGCAHEAAEVILRKGQPRRATLRSKNFKEKINLYSKRNENVQRYFGLLYLCWCSVSTSSLSIFCTRRSLAVTLWTIEMAAVYIHTYKLACMLPQLYRYLVTPPESRMTPCYDG